MAFDQSTRGRLQKLVNSCRGLLSDEFSIQLQQTYGLDPKTGEVTPMARLTHLDDRQRHTAEVLRQTLAHYLGADADDTDHRIAVLDRMVREQAFTVLNRLAALLMMEARGQLIESVSKGYQSRGYQLYSKIAGTALGETGQAYQVYLFSVFDELAQELPALFDRYAANGLLFPRETALRALLDELNHFEIEPLWAADETIGWIYQYFNSKEERKAMRDASQAPRNSRELAVRNQFFTPRYVVEFLVDNTLGRLWFNATGGQTELRDRCRYLLIKPDEQPQAAIKLRDPRTLKLLDPACGSMHFGLYAFDLFAEIYLEAWAWEQHHGPGSLDVSTQPQAALMPLCQTYEDEAALERDVPRLIIEHNIYGVDIDPRAAQIATLALWLRAQRAWHDANIKAKDRPRIGQGNVVAAIAPPAERELRRQFIANLDRLDAELFEKTLQLLKGLPEMGVLLPIERELPQLIRQVFGEHGSLFKEADMEHWQKAEVRLREALTEFAQASQSTYQGRLFAQDALQGLRLVDLCRELFDVVVMNPPFGEPPDSYRQNLKSQYPSAADNLAVCFMLRGKALLSPFGLVGSITDCSWAKKFDYKDFRSEILNAQDLHAVIHLGWEVLDNANVETNVAIRGYSSDSAFYIDISKAQDKAGELALSVSENSQNKIHDYLRFKKLPNAAFVFEMSNEEYSPYADFKRVSQSYMNVIAGVKSCDSTADFRLWWEIKPGNIGKKKNWWLLHNGSPYCPFHYPVFFAVRSDKGQWTQLMANGGARPGEAHYPLSGIVYGKRTDTMYGYIKREGEVFSQEGQCAFPVPPVTIWGALALINSSVYAKHANYVAGQHKYHNYLNNICLSVDKIPTDSLLAKEVHSLLSSLDCSNECTLDFTFPYDRPEFDPRKSESDRSLAAESLLSRVNQIRAEVDIELCKALELDNLPNEKPVDYYHHYFGESFSAHLVGSVWFSHLVGLAFGRWNSSTSANDAHAESPFEIQSHGILVDDLGHPDNLQSRMRTAACQMWSSESDSIENVLFRSLGVQNFGEYLDKPQGFFADHLRRYSKSRRQAPIYWPLSTASGSYVLWVYYPSLNNQTLFTAVNDFLDGPNGKLTQVSRECAELRIKGSGRSRDEEKQYETLQTFEQELTDLRDTLLKIAPTYQPYHDDGVQITAAPLWSLFRHKPWQKVLKDTWTKLEKGDYDWAHLAMAYWPDRVCEKCKTDKSLAIAHGLEDLYVEPEAAPKKTRKKKGDV